MCLCACDCHKSESRNDWTHWRSSLLTTLSHCRRVVYCCRFVLQSVPKLVQHRARFQLKSFVARSVCNIRACFGLLDPSNLLRRQPTTAHFIRTNNNWERCITDSGISTYGLTDLRKGDEHKHSACLHLGWKTLFGLNSLVRCHSFSSFLTLLFYVVFVYCCFYVLRCVYQININNNNDNANLVWLKSMKVYIIFFRPDSNITHVKDPCQMSITLTVTTITVCLNGWMKLIRHDIFEC